MPLKLGLIAPSLPLDPLSASLPALPFIAPMFQSLLHADRRGEPARPDLAERHEVSSDGKVHHFWLRDAAFHDGQAVRATDVAASLSRHVRPDSPSLFASTLRGLLSRGGSAKDDGIAESIEADDGRGCVTIRLAAPYAPFDELLAHPVMGITRRAGNGQVVGSGPSSAHRGHGDELHLIPCPGYRGPRRPHRPLILHHFGSADALEAALAAGRIDACAVERRHYGAFARHASTPLRDRWVGALMLNAGGALGTAPLRRDFGRMAQAIAEDAFGDDFRPVLLPPGLATPPYYARERRRLSPAEFAGRWRTRLEDSPVRILFSPGRGRLTRILELLIAAMRQHDVPCRIIEAAEPAGIYAAVAQGDFDVVSRGWAQDYDDADEFIGIHDKQAPGALAQRHLHRFQARIAAARHLLPPARRLAAYTGALMALEAQWLCVPVCGDFNRVFHATSLALNAQGRDLFTRAPEGAAAAAPA